MKSDPETEAVFKAWWLEHRGVFHRIARAYAPVPEDQADLFQDMAVQLWRSLPGFNGQCQPVTWIYRVCLNTAMGWQRRKRSRPTLVAGESDQINRTASADPRPGWSQEKGEILERLYAAIRTLPIDEKTVVTLSLDGLSYRDIGEVTGLKENHVGVVLTRARQKLAEKLKEVKNEL